MYSSYLVVLFYCHFIWFYLTCLNEINGYGDGEFSGAITTQFGFSDSLWGRYCYASRATR